MLGRHDSQTHGQAKERHGELRRHSQQHAQRHAGKGGMADGLGKKCHPEIHHQNAHGSCHGCEQEQCQKRLLHKAGLHTVKGAEMGQQCVERCQFRHDDGADCNR